MRTGVTNHTELRCDTVATMSEDPALQPLRELGATPFLERHDHGDGSTFFTLLVNWRGGHDVPGAAWNRNLHIRGWDLDDLVAHAVRMVHADTTEEPDES